MSAFQVSPNHIERILATWRDLGPRAPSALGFDCRATVTQVAAFAIFAKANAETRTARYPSNPCDPVDTTFARVATALPLPPVAALKAIDCLSYQCSELPGWAEAEACGALDQLRGALIKSLPGYSDAAWSIV